MRVKVNCKSNVHAFGAKENDVKTDNRCNEKRYVVPARCLFEQRNEEEKKRRQKTYRFDGTIYQQQKLGEKNNNKIQIMEFFSLALLEKEQIIYTKYDA